MPSPTRTIARPRHGAIPMKNARRLFLLASLVVMATHVPRGIAAEWNLGRQTYLLVRALGYNDSLRAHAKGEVAIAILFKSGDPRSQADATNLAAALGDMEGTRIQGMGFQVRVISYVPKAGIKTALTGPPVNVLYLCDGLESYLDEITDLTRRQNILTVAGNEAMVVRGAGLGIISNKQGESPIVINLRATRKEGASFGSDLLRMARVVRDESQINRIVLPQDPR